jgi:hypothetical protein
MQGKTSFQVLLSTKLDIALLEIDPHVESPQEIQTEQSVHSAGRR